jgi:hypothetical protein
MHQLQSKEKERKSIGNQDKWLRQGICVHTMQCHEPKKEKEAASFNKKEHSFLCNAMLSKCSLAPKCHKMPQNLTQPTPIQSQYAKRKGKKMQGR